MINRIIKFSVYNSGLVLLLTLLVVIAGVFAFQTLPIDAVPDITNNQVQINTVVDGLAPEEIERGITFPVESSMRGLPDVEQVRSITRFGLSQVTVVFADKVDIYRARQLVSERLQGVSAELPKGANPELGPVSSGLGEIYQYVIEFKKLAPQDTQERLLQLMELRRLQDRVVKPFLLTVPGVAEVNTSGGFEKQYHVQPDTKKMAAYGLHFDDIVEALENANQNVGGGYVQQTAEQFLVQGVGLFKNVDDIKNVSIKTLESFKQLKIGDIATVQLGKELRTGASTYNGRESLLGTAMMLLGENSRTVALRVDAKLKELRKQLPQDVEVITVYDRSDLVNATLGTVEHNLLMGAGLVLLILLLLLGNVRAAVITALTIPLALLATFLVMKPLGISGNLMSLGALDFGIIVDGTVIVMDNCVRFIQNRAKQIGRKLTKEELKDAIYAATLEIRQAAAFGELIIIVVFLPIFALVGVEGKMFKPMAATFAIAVGAALVISFTTAPALASIFLARDAKEKEPRLMIWARKFYQRLFETVWKWQRAALSIAAASVVIGAILLASRGAEFLPQLGEGSFAFHMIRPVNTSLDVSIKYQEKADVVLKTFAEVKHAYSRIGTSEVATDPMGVNVSDSIIMLHDRSEWPEVNGKRRTYPELVAAMIEKLNLEVPGQVYLASQPIQMRFNELLEGTRADVSVKVFGPDLKELVEIAKKIQSTVAKVEGAGDVEVDLAGTSPVLKIEPQSKNLDRYNATGKDVLEAVQIALGGAEAGTMYEGQNRSPIVVRLSDEKRSNLQAIKELPVGIAGGTTTNLSDLSKISFEETYGSINREDSLRRSAVLINLRGRDTESFVSEAQKKVEQEIKLPEGYYTVWGGNFKNLQEARNRLLLLVPVALLLVLLMIYSAFGSIGQTALIFLCVPFALVGGILSLMLNQLPFSISAGIGFIALSGVAVLNGVVLINYFNQLKEQGLSGKQLVQQGTSVRLRPILMTALVAVFGFIPMMLSSGVGSEVQRPLAAVVIGGILSSTFLTLIILPILFSKFENKFKAKIMKGH